MGVERARLLADNIELDQRATELSEYRAAAASASNNSPPQEAEGRAALAALDEALKDPAHRIAIRARKALARSNWSWSANKAT